MFKSNQSSSVVMAAEGGIPWVSLWTSLWYHNKWSLRSGSLQTICDGWYAWYKITSLMQQTILAATRWRQRRDDIGSQRWRQPWDDIGSQRWRQPWEDIGSQRWRQPWEDIGSHEMTSAMRGYWQPRDDVRDEMILAARDDVSHERILAARRWRQPCDDIGSQRWRQPWDDIGSQEMTSPSPHSDTIVCLLLI